MKNDMSCKYCCYSLKFPCAYINAYFRQKETVLTSASFAFVQNRAPQ